MPKIHDSLIDLITVTLAKVSRWQSTKFFYTQLNATDPLITLGHALAAFINGP